MKNLTKLIGGIGLAGALSFGGCGKEDKGLYEKFILSYDYHDGLLIKISAGGSKKEDNCAWSSIVFEDTNNDRYYDKILTYIHINKEEAKCRQIELDYDKKTLDYSLYSKKHSLESCKWDGPERNKVSLKNVGKNDLTLELQKEIEFILNLKKFCNDDWKLFLKKEFDKSYTKFENLPNPFIQKEKFFEQKSKISGINKDKFVISRYQVLYSDLDETRFPRVICAYAKNKNDDVLCALCAEEVNGDQIYDNIKLLTNVNFSGKKYGYRKEEINVDPSSGKVIYSELDQNSRGYNLRAKNMGLIFSNRPDLRQRFKEINKARIDCSNDLIPFLYDEEILRGIRQTKENRIIK